ncbi:hypothetical protein CYCD_13540 [Tenuifilaceae bacterium CYCD]|nr:hypothetical protein CYCD_13540 [Tenuifilaceae bacterium CYCD]
MKTFNFDNMKSLYKALVFTILFFYSEFLYSQVTITEIKKIEVKDFLKPEPYDSLKNWETFEKIGEYKKYIGLQVYLIPFTNPHLYYDNRESTQLPLLLSNHPNTIPVNPKLHPSFNKIYTSIYKPYNYSVNNYGGSVGLCSDSNEVCNKYFTIIDVLYDAKLKDYWNRLDITLRDAFRKNNDAKNGDVHIDRYDFMGTNNAPELLFVLRNDINGDTIYSEHTSRFFLLVPYFVKQKQLYQNKYLIYDDEKEYGNYRYPTLKEFDSRYIVKSENDDGEVVNTGKEVIIEPGSKWFCFDVTLLGPTYDIHYILKNEKDEQVALVSLKGFIEKQSYIKRETDKKIQKQQLLAKRKQEDIIRTENARKVFEKRRTECIKKFGLQNGELIAQGKVRIGMSKEMCKYSWGTPFWTSKTTTVNSIDEDWYYGLGFSLHFENDYLIRIDE